MRLIYTPVYLNDLGKRSSNSGIVLSICIVKNDSITSLAWECCCNNSRIVIFCRNTVKVVLQKIGKAKGEKIAIRLRNFKVKESFKMMHDDARWTQRESGHWTFRESSCRIRRQQFKRQAMTDKLSSTVEKSTSTITQQTSLRPNFFDEKKMRPIHYSSGMMSIVRSRSERFGSFIFLWDTPPTTL